MKAWERVKQSILSAVDRLLTPCLQRALSSHVEALSRRQDALTTALMGHCNQLHQAQSLLQQTLHDDQLLALSAIRLQYLHGQPPVTPQAWEFTCFSQYGEDGLIQYLLYHLPSLPRTFVEIGVQDYRESNTRFLLMHDNWRGLIVDADDQHVPFLENRELRWRHQIEAVQSFVTRDNIDALLDQAGFMEGLGLLSIDIDGMDYWVWDAMQRHQPGIVIIEYNSLFGAHHAITVPYEETFNRATAHPSHLYFGASLAAMAHLAGQKGYRLVCGNEAGSNACFVRDDLATDFPCIEPATAYRPSRFRESRDEQGGMTYVSTMRDRLRLIGHLPVCDVVTGAVCALEALDGEGASPEREVPS
ncbi:MAG: hypothetical protein HQ523_01950 [Lentisphaerae bacterium]|nr:hypothetical protein [Lentisphaerota bacterium]